MKIVTKIDPNGRIVIPKKLRDRYGLHSGRPVQIIPTPEGVSIVVQQPERRFIRRGPILCIKTGEGAASLADFDVDRLRGDHLDEVQE